MHPEHDRGAEPTLMRRRAKRRPLAPFCLLSGAGLARVVAGNRTAAVHRGKTMGFAEHGHGGWTAAKRAPRRTWLLPAGLVALTVAGTSEAGVDTWQSSPELAQHICAGDWAIGYVGLECIDDCDGVHPLAIANSACPCGRKGALRARAAVGLSALRRQQY
ncbi:MAG: hypothetical protein ACUVX9_18340 [Anaerolineae bacterium]